MLIRCPTCQCQSRIVASEQLDKNTRQIYAQCKNYNCGSTFPLMMTALEPSRKISNPKPPDANLQPELYCDLEKMGLLPHEPNEAAI